MLLQAMLARVKPTIPQTDLARIFSVGNVERELWQVALEEKERSAYLWSLLTLVPYIGGLFLAYALYRVNNDFQKHERSEFAALGDIQQTVSLTVASPIHSEPGRFGGSWFPHRNSIFYFLLSVLTVGLFSIYWLDVSIHDPEPHFKAQSQLEDAMKEMITRLGSNVTPLGSVN